MTIHTMQSALDKNSSIVSNDLQENIISKLNNVSASLKEAIDSNEINFIALGNNLQLVAKSAQSIATNIKDNAQQITHFLKKDRIVALQKVIEQYKTFFSGIEHSYKEHIVTMQTVGINLQKLGKINSKINHISFSLSVVALNMSIQSSYTTINFSSFALFIKTLHHLAESINSISNNINTDISNASEMFAAVYKILNDSMRTLTIVIDKLSKMTNKTVYKLEALLEESNLFFKHASEASKDMYTSIGELVAGIQFYDILRQKVEHICTAFTANTYRHTAQEPANHTDSSMENDMVSLFHIITLQEHHIKDLLKRIDETHATFSTHFAQIDSAIVLLRTGTDKNSNDSAYSVRNKPTLFSSVIHDTGQLADLVNRAQSVQRFMQQSINNLFEILNKLDGFLKHIKNISDDLKLHAINAEILTQDNTDIIRSLNIIAQEVKNITKESQIHINGVDEILKTILQNIHSIHTSLNEQSTNETNSINTSSGIQTIESIVTEMSSLYNSAIEKTGTTHKQSDILRVNITDIKSKISFLKEIQSHCISALHDLAEVKKEIVGRVGHITIQKTDSQLEQLLSHYTMESERIVHRDFLSNNTNTPLNESSVLESGENNENESLGDNVELF